MTSAARRLYLSVAVKLLFLAGLGALAMVLIASIGIGGGGQPAAADPWRLEVDWSAIAPGEYRAVEWPSGERIWIYRRRPGTIAQLAARTPGELQDPGSRHSRQPADLNPAWRSWHPDVFVFFPYESRRGCRVRLDADRRQWVDPCHGARFDLAGRLLRGTGVAEQQNLRVPDYELIGPQRLRLLPPGT